MTQPREERDERLWYVDRLRVLVLVLVFTVHVCEVFNPWDEWHITNTQRSRVLGEIVVVLASWLMPLVMLLCGVSAWYSLQRRTNAEYVRERAVRLLLPLVVGTLLLVPPQVYLERLRRGQFHGSFLSFYPTFFTGLYPDGNFSWHHLWFLGHLFGYSIIALPLFRLLQQPRGAPLLRAAARLCGARGGVFWLAVPLILERQLLWGLFPERHMLTSDWSNHALLVVAYAYGFVLAGVPWLRTAIDEQWRRALVVAGAGTFALTIGTWQGDLPTHMPPPYTGIYLLFWSLYALCAWAWMVALLGLGRRWLNRDGPVTRYGREAGFAWYVFHQPVIVAIGFVVVTWQVGVGTKVAVLAVASAAGTLLATELARRVPFISQAFGASRASEYLDSPRSEREHSPLRPGSSSLGTL